MTPVLASDGEVISVAKVLPAGEIQKRSRSAIQTFYTEGCKLTRAGKLSEAVDAFTLAIENNIHRAEAYFRRGVCHYRLGNFRKTANDMDAATVLGCQDAQMWSRYALRQNDDTDEPSSENS